MYDPGTVNMHNGSIQMVAENCRSRGPKGGFHALHLGGGGGGEARNEFFNNVVTICVFFILNTNGRTWTKKKTHQTSPKEIYPSVFTNIANTGIHTNGPCTESYESNPYSQTVFSALSTDFLTV
jgi:hypothetical protein